MKFYIISGSDFFIRKVKTSEIYKEIIKSYITQMEALGVESTCVSNTKGRIEKIDEHKKYNSWGSQITNFFIDKVDSNNIMEIQGILGLDNRVLSSTHYSNDVRDKVKFSIFKMD